MTLKKQKKLNSSNGEKKIIMRKIVDREPAIHLYSKQ